MKSVKKKIVRKEEDRWIDVHNDETMRKMGFFRPLDQLERDKNVWTKNSYERKSLKIAKYSGKDMHFHSIPRKIIPVQDKLIIYLTKNKKFPKTTYSVICFMHDIPNILANYNVVNSKTKMSKSVVSKYSFNGKTYKPDELPVWNL
jgi:hypothetical protein